MPCAYRAGNAGCVVGAGFCYLKACNTLLQIEMVLCFLQQVFTLFFEIGISLSTIHLFPGNFYLYFPACLKILAKGPQRW